MDWLKKQDGVAKMKSRVSLGVVFGVVAWLGVQGAGQMAFAEDAPSSHASKAANTEKAGVEQTPGGGGGEIGSGGPDTDEVDGRYDRLPEEDLAGHCGGAVAVLRNHEMDALVVEMNGDLQGARATLKGGLRAAKRVLRKHTSLLTYRAIVRGLKLDEVFHSADPVMASGPALDRENRAAVHLLNEYYHFIYEVSEKLDLPYFIPYYAPCCKDWERDCHCGDYDSLPEDLREIRRRFESAYGDYAQDLIDLTLDNAETMAMDDYELKVDELVTNWSWKELDQSLLRRRFRCAKSALDGLHTLLQLFNSGDHAGRTSPQMVYEARRRLRKIDRIIQREAMPCDDYRGHDEGRR